MKIMKKAKDIYHKKCTIEKAQLKLIEMEIQLVKYVGNITFLELLFIVGIKHMMELRNH